MYPLPTFHIFFEKQKAALRRSIEGITAGCSRMIVREMQAESLFPGKGLYMSGKLDKYLYAIRTQRGKFLCVRSVDVAHFLKLSKPSVSTSVRQMMENGLVTVEPDGNLLLTALGQDKADRLNERVRFFEDLLVKAGVESSTALQDALAFGPKMSTESFEAFRTILRDY